MISEENKIQNAQQKTKPIQEPAQAEISEPVVTEKSKEEVKPIEPSQEIKSVEEISAPVETVEQPPADSRSAPVMAGKQTQEITEEAPQPIIEPETKKTEPVAQKQPQPQIIEKIIYKTDPNIIQKLLTKARAKIQERKRAKLDKIMEFFQIKPQITNKDVQKLLHARKRTATNYLNQLEAENKITQVGTKGKGVFYVQK